MANFYCEYCGYKTTSVQSLVIMTCPRHPLGSCKGKHKLYEGSEKPKYTCKYCGYQANSIQSLVSMLCIRHPAKGRHEPSL